MAKNFTCFLCLIAYLLNWLVNPTQGQQANSTTTCSKGAVDQVECMEDGDTCNEDTISSCNTVSCGANSCENTIFYNSKISCKKDEDDSYLSNACEGAYFNASIVEMDYSGCSYCNFWFSAVTTNVPFADYDNMQPKFSFCSCCDDTGSNGNNACPDDVPSCTNDLVAFCSEIHHFKSCKGWGNPMCQNLSNDDVPDVIEVKTDASTCSTGVDTINCLTEYSCENLEVNDCTVLCYENACHASTIKNSVVGCYSKSEYIDSCQESLFWYGFVDIRGAECISCKFYFSAVTTTSAFSDFTIWEPSFNFCSCCDDIGDDNHCPKGVSRCTSDDPTTDATTFCSMEHHFRTCKDWGNPICDNINVPSIQSKTDASTCSAGLETVWCTTQGTSTSCEGMEIFNCTTICEDGACQNAVLDHSVVGCYNQGSYLHRLTTCNDATFKRSFVQLDNLECTSCKFWFSAVTINSPFSSSSIWEPKFGFCSCCDDTSGDNNCPGEVPSCAEDPIELCSISHLGKTCKEWGNPICSDINEALTDPTMSDSESSLTTDETCSLPEGDNFICAGTTCQGLEVDRCTLECYDESCANGVYQKSAIACLGDDACSNSKFYNSMVDCTDSSCDSSDFFASAVFCGSSGDNLETCNGELMARCTCCDGEDCVSEFKCADDPIQVCNRTYLGRTCKDWGNPICNDVELPSLPPLTPAESCNLNEDIYICDERQNGCLGLVANTCTVACNGKVCNQASFEDSFVDCFDRPVIGFFDLFPGEACASTTFFRSIASCQHSCVGATFEDSYVNCPHTSCTETIFNGCSCCDGEGCPFGTPTCDGNIDNICSREVDGQTCACRGLPLCSGGEYFEDCPQVEAMSKEMKSLEVNKAMNSEVLFKPGSSKSSSARLESALLFTSIMSLLGAWILQYCAL